MAKDAASLLSQISDLMQQYLALPGDTPLKATFQDVLPEVHQGIQGMQGGGEPPAEQAGDTGPETPQEDTGEGGPPPNFKSAREAALPALRKMMDKSKGPGPDQGTDQIPGKKKDKKARAKSY